MSWTVQHIPDQSGRVAVVTGANGGLGFETARALAGAGASVVMAARDLDRAEVARQAILGDHPQASLEVVALDLASLSSVEVCAGAVVGSNDHLDVLVNNGGLMATPEERTEDGLELQLGTNHLGHFVLTARLLPAMVATPGSRVVTVTSFAYLIGRTIDPANPNLVGAYNPWRGYAQSKLANLQFAVELDRRLAAAGAQASSLVAHPGLADTGLQVASVAASGGWSQRFFHILAHATGMPPARGALPQLRAATDPAARGGDLYAPRMVTRGAPVRRRRVLRRYSDPARTRTLWDVSERETGVRFDVAAIVTRDRPGSTR